MMNKLFSNPRSFTSIATLVLLAMTLSGCLFNKEKEANWSAPSYYEKANKFMSSGDFETATRYYETLEARYPFSRQARQGQLDLIYVYYRNGQPESILDATRQFERENPTHPRVDYAIYMRGMALFAGERDGFHKLFRVDLSKRPPKDARDSYSAFAELVRRFPDSRYAPDARQRMLFLRNRVAEHENHIARYYYKRGAYAAAISRAGYAIQVFDGAPATGDSLLIMANSYRKLGMTDLALNTERVLVNSYPDIPVKDLIVDETSWYQFW
jgi:outer membrane protein assembly factor BamD